MIAKCAKCQEVFTTESWGRQQCPKCGAELFLNAPPGTPTQPAEQPAPLAVQPFVGQPGQADGPQDQPTPWEQRATLGFMNAWVETLKQTMLDPLAFFTRMRVDKADGALSYFWLNAALGGFVGAIWQTLLALIGPHGKALPVPPDAPPAVAQLMESLSQVMESTQSPRSHLILAVSTIFIAPISLYVWAGVLHLGSLLFGGGKSGFQATLKAVAYSSGPYLLQLVPLCGGFVGSIWALVLTVIALWKAQRTGLGTSIGAVVLPLVLVCCCFGMGLGMLALGGLASTGAFK